MPPRPRLVRALGVSLLALAALFAAPSAALAAAPPGPPPEGSTVTPAHVWVDPTHPNGDGEVWFFVTITFPVPDTHWVTHAIAPRLTDGSTHCQTTKTATGVTFACTSAGTAIPAEISSALSVRSEGGDDFGWVIPITVCPLTGCSDLFELTLSETAWEVCPGEDLAALDPVVYEFNVPWNAAEVRVGSLAAAGGDPEFFSGPPAAGSEFTATGSLQNPGSYELPVTLVDEFGSDHTATIDVTVKTAAACGQLAATGSALEGTTALATGMLGLIAAGVIVLAAASRRAARR